MKGELLAFMAALLWGTVPLLDKIIAATAISPVAANIVRSAGALLSLLLLSLLMRELSFEGIRGVNILILLTAGAIAGGIAMVIYYGALKSIGAAKAVPITSVYPLVTVVLSVLILGEKVNLPKVMAGTLLIVLGLVLVTTQ